MSDSRARLGEISALIEDRTSRKSIRETCLFLGAGADISSGGMTFRQFKNEFYRLLLGESTLTDESIIAREVNAFLDRASEPTVRARLVEATFNVNRRRQPSESYLLLALALEKSVVDAVFTTNFDVMLENAERMLGLSILRVFAKGVALPDESDAKIR